MDAMERVRYAKTLKQMDDEQLVITYKHVKQRLDASPVGSQNQLELCQKMPYIRAELTVRKEEQDERA